MYNIFSALIIFKLNLTTFISYSWLELEFFFPNHPKSQSLK